jgi:hypothetical protein
MADRPELRPSSRHPRAHFPRTLHTCLEFAPVCCHSLDWHPPDCAAFSQNVRSTVLELSDSRAKVALPQPVVASLPRVCVLYLKPDRSAGWTCEVRDKGHDFIELTFVSAV